MSVGRTSRRTEEIGEKTQKINEEVTAKEAITLKKQRTYFLLLVIGQ